MSDGITDKRLNTNVLPPPLAKKLDQMDRLLNELLEELQKYSDDDLNWQPGPQKWSVLQVMQHVRLSELQSLNYVKKKLSFNPELKKVGISTKLRGFLTTAYLASPFKVKAPPAISGENLPDRSSFWDVVKQWKSQREALKKYLEEIPKENLHLQIYKHPFAGRLGVNQMLDFFIGHFKRHRKQINDVLKNYRY